MLRSTISQDAIRKGQELFRIGQCAVQDVQQENRRLGIPNVYSINGVIYYQLPNGELTQDDPYRGPGAAEPRLPHEH
jgi:hypothetical protein